MDYGKELARTALEIGAFKLRPREPFTWASGFRMPVYNDNRQLLQRAETRRLVAEGFSGLLAERKESPRVVAGVATSGIPHATTLADLLGLPLVYVRDKPKGHGMRNRIEGLAAEADLGGASVVLVEDLISTGESAAKAVLALREARGDCGTCLAIFSYAFPQSRDLFSGMEPACRLSPLFDFGLLLEAAMEKGVLREGDRRLLEEWRDAPFEWGERHGFPREGRP